MTKSESLINPTITICSSKHLRKKGIHDKKSYSCVIFKIKVSFISFYGVWWIKGDCTLVPCGHSVASESQFFLRWRARRGLRETIVFRVLWVVQGDVVLPILKEIEQDPDLKKGKLQKKVGDIISPAELTGRLLSCSRSPRIWTKAGKVGLSFGSPCQQASMMPYLPAEGSAVLTRITSSKMHLQMPSYIVP